jgi:hypothetical protein
MKAVYGPGSPRCIKFVCINIMIGQCSQCGARGQVDTDDDSGLTVCLSCMMPKEEEDSSIGDDMTPALKGEREEGKKRVGGPLPQHFSSTQLKRQKSSDGKVR